MQAFEEVLDQIRVRGFVVDNDPSVEARDNLYLLAAGSDVARTLTVDRVTRFLDDARRMLASGASDFPRPLRFYAWFDEMAGQLRFCVSSAAKLPFGISLRLTSDPAVIVRQFLQGDHLDGIPWSDFREIDGDDDEPTPEHEPLDVFVTELNMPE